MAFADTSDSKLLIHAQSAWDTISTTATDWRYMRFNSEGLMFAADTNQSEEITQSGRGVSDLIRTAGSAQGDIEFELSYDVGTDYLLQGALQDSAWAANVIQNGSQQQYFAFEKQFTGTDTDYFLAENCAVTGLEISVETGNIVMATASMLGSTISLPGTTGESSYIAAGTSVAAGTNNVISAVSSNVEIHVSSNVSSSTALTDVQSASFAIDNSLREQRRIGSSALTGVGSGRCVVTGSIVQYFADNDEYITFMNETDRQIKFVLTDSVDDKGYTFVFPKVRYSSCEILASGVDSDIVASFEWQALEHSTDGTVQVTRHSS
jgi:hypothetical protein